MKRSKFTEEQIIGIVKEHEAGAKTTDLCRKHGMSDATFYIYGRLSRCKRSDRYPGELGRQHLSGVTRDAGAPKWVIRAA
jgi:succinylarginine dihydrolase